MCELPVPCALRRAARGLELLQQEQVRELRALDAALAHPKEGQ